MRTISATRSLAVTLALGALVGACSFSAPSDEELMGGGGNGAASSQDAGDGWNAGGAAGDSAIDTGKDVRSDLAVDTAVDTEAAVEVGGSAGASGSGGSAGSGATGGAGGIAGSGLGGAGGTAGTGGAAGPENCVNGIDDNGDGLIDCADPQCTSGFVCVQSPPAAWTAVGWVDHQAGSACPSLFSASTIELYEQSAIDAQPAQCSCGCGAPSGGSCSTSLTCHSGTGCSGSPIVTTALSGQTCVQFMLPSATDSCTATPLQAQSGSCQVQAGAVIPASSWPKTVRGCVPLSGGACPATGQSCQPKLPGAQGACIARVGDNACPAFWGKKTLYYDGVSVSDTRACDSTGCSCGAAAATCSCSGTCAVSVYSSTSCSSGQVGSVPTNGTCALVHVQKPQEAALVASTVSLGPCPPQGQAKATGSFSPTGPITVCCMQ